MSKGAILSWFLFAAVVVFGSFGAGATLSSPYPYPIRASQERRAIEMNQRRVEQLRKEAAEAVARAGKRPPEIRAFWAGIRTTGAPAGFNAFLWRSSSLREWLYDEHGGVDLYAFVENAKAIDALARGMGRPRSSLDAERLKLLLRLGRSRSDMPAYWYASNKVPDEVIWEAFLDAPEKVQDEVIWIWVNPPEFQAFLDAVDRIKREDPRSLVYSRAYGDVVSRVKREDPARQIPNARVYIEAMSRARGEAFVSGAAFRAMRARAKREVGD